MTTLEIKESEMGVMPPSSRLLMFEFSSLILQGPLSQSQSHPNISISSQSNTVCYRKTNPLMPLLVLCARSCAKSCALGPVRTSCADSKMFSSLNGNAHCQMFAEG